MTDLEILGLTEPYSHEDLKKAFRKKCKLYHPDKNQDNLNSHLAMIRLNHAYSNLQKQLKEKSPLPRIKPVKDPSYRIYKEGIKKFQSIHPSKWVSYSLKGFFDSQAVKYHVDAPTVINSLISDMAVAYQLFSVIVNEHENSPWFADAVRRMKEIEKMTQRYMKIKVSYETEMEERKQKPLRQT